MAKTAGFCFGIERAVNIVYKEIEESKLVYTYGPITHNEEVIKDLTNKGVKVLESLEELKNIEKSTIVIRAHGVA